ncbi:MAG TPA: MoaD/ThiS family protein [Hanamia sp.]|nr:MoaD/ThiS family protein [Hanamia sp.]
MEIKAFGQLTDIFERETISIESVKDLNELKEKLIKSFPALSQKSFVIAVNKQIIHNNVSLNEDAEIALLPPFSGG